jgi:hypothetical protein
MNKFIKENKPILIFIAIVLAIIIAKNTDLFGINLQTEEVQFYNKDIVIPFTLTNFTNPTIEVYFNNIKLYDQSSNITDHMTYTQSLNNGVYTITVKYIASAGTLKITAIENGYSEVQNIEVRQAYVDIKDNIPNLVDKSKIWDMEIDTYNPQGDILEADSIDIDVYDPLNNKNTIFLDKSGNKFTTKFTYTNDGNYQFKIHARKEGYITREVTRITSVTRSEGVNPIVYIWVGAAVLWALLFLIKLMVSTKR